MTEEELSRLKEILLKNYSGDISVFPNKELVELTNLLWKLRVLWEY